MILGVVVVVLAFLYYMGYFIKAKWVTKNFPGGPAVFTEIQMNIRDL